MIIAFLTFKILEWDVHLSGKNKSSRATFSARNYLMPELAQKDNCGSPSKPAGMTYNLGVSFSGTCVFSLLHQAPSGPYWWKVYPVATVKHSKLTKSRRTQTSGKRTAISSKTAMH